MSDEIIALKKRLEEHETRIANLENYIKPKIEAVTLPKIGNDIDKLASKLGISIDKFHEIYDIENETLTVLKFVGEKVKEKTQNITLLALLGYKYFFNREMLSAQEIRRNVAENSIALDNFGTYLNELAPSLVRRKGEPKSPKTTYRLTVLGEAKAKELLKSVVGN